MADVGVFTTTRVVEVTVRLRIDDEHFVHPEALRTVPSIGAFVEGAVRDALLEARGALGQRNSPDHPAYVGTDLVLWGAHRL